MHETGSGVRFLQRGQTLFDLRVARGGQPLHDQAQRPDHVHSDMRSARTVGGFAMTVIGICIRQHQLARVLVDFIVRLHRAKIWQREQARNIAVINAVIIAEPVHFVSVNLSQFGMMNDGMFLQRRLHFVGKVPAFFGQAVS